MTLLTSCAALVAEDDPTAALDLDDSLKRLGFSVLGPVDNSAAALQLMHHQRPNIALVSASAPDCGFVLLASVLISMTVPFGVMATGYDQPMVGQEPVLRGAPRLAKPWDIRSLHQITRELYRCDLELKIADADRRITAGIRQVADQIRKVEALAAISTPQAASAELLLSAMTRSLRLMRTSRALGRLSKPTFGPAFPGIRGDSVRSS